VKIFLLAFTVTMALLLLLRPNFLYTLRCRLHRICFH
jgi:hypothetical protein